MRNGPIGAGDGQCRLASAQDFCRGFDPEFEDASVCSHPCVQEMIDCIDSPVLANSRDAVELMRDTCTGPSAGCVPIIFDMGTFFGEALHLALCFSACHLSTHQYLIPLKSAFFFACTEKEHARS